MLAITTKLEHIGHWIKMRQSLARFSGPESSPQIRSSADFIVTTSEFKFSVHTGSSMSSKDQFAALEVMSRERAALAKKEMEYWLAESEEWKQLRQSSDPFAERRITRTEGYPGSNYQ